MGAACLVRTDLSAIRLVEDDADRAWTAPDGGDAPAPLESIAADAAHWIAQALRRKRLDTLLIGVEDAQCAWIAAPTREPQVIAAAVRQRGSEWGDAVDAASVEPLIETEQGDWVSRAPLIRYARRRPVEQRAAHAAVLTLHDAGVRLLLDELDARGVRVGTTMTVWHAAAQRWGGGDEHASPENADAVVWADEDRLLWAWSDHEGDLLAGGATAVPHKAPVDDDGAPDDPAARTKAAVGRLSLDWLTWSAQLGLAPARARVLAPDPAPVADALARAWPDARVEPERVDDPVGALLAGDLPRPRADEDPRRAVGALVRRPGRHHRRVYRLGALALILLAAAVVGFAVREARVAANHRDRAQQVRAASSQIVSEVAPPLADNPDPVGALESYLAQVKRDNPPIQRPDPPRPVFDETLRVLEAMEPIEEATLSRLTISDRNANVRMSTRSYAAADRMRQRLTTGDGDLRWTEGQISGSPPNLRQNFTGIWKDLFE